MQAHYPKFHVKPPEEPSESWVRDFIRRHDMKTKATITMEHDRVKMGTIGNVDWWFTNVYEKVDLTKYSKFMIGNCDESMLESKARMIGVIHRHDLHAVISQDPEHEHVTILTCATVNGDYMP